MIGGNERNRRGLYSANMTPLIDVSLVLVVILMLLTPLAFESSIIMRRTAEGEGKSERTVEAEPVKLLIVSSDSLVVDGQVIKREDLEDVLKSVFTNKNTRNVEIACGGGVLHGVFVNILDQAKICGALNISVRGGSR
jgi:biopolymer transport protein ExbD